MEQDLGKKLIKGTLWVTATRLGLRGLSVISTMVLAWLLTPADFGIVAMAAIVADLMVACTEVGMNQVIIYNRNTEKSFLDTAWTIQMIRGLILGIIMFLFSNIIASFFNEQLLVPVFRVLSLIFILNGMISINIILFQKEMRFDKEFYYKIFTQSICLIGTIAMAFWLRNYWAMVFGNILFAMSSVVLSYCYMPGFPRPTLLHWRRIFGYSQWIFLREAGTQLSGKIDQILVGRLLDTASIGRYEMSKQISTLPATEIAMPLSRSLFPALAALQDKAEQFRHTFSISLAAVLLIALPASFGLMLIAKPLVLFLLPARWEQIGEIIQILTLFGLMRVTFGPCFAALTAIGKFKEMLIITILNLLLKCCTIYLGYMYNGIIGIAWGTVVSSSSVTLVCLLRARYHNYLDFNVLIKQIWRPGLATGMMIGCVYTIQRIVISMQYGSSIETCAMVITGVAVYCLTLFGLWRIIGKPEGIETRLLTILSDIIKKFRKSNNK